MTALSPSQIESYRRNGFLFPLRVFSDEETRCLRERLETAEAAAEPGKERAVRQGLPITHAWAWDLVHDPRIVEPIAALLGPDVLLWSMDWFIKEPSAGERASASRKREGEPLARKEPSAGERASASRKREGGLPRKKQPAPAYVSYHQDATYWGLEPHHVATAWIALSDAGPNTGPMRFLPGSHAGPVFAQEDTFAADNLLSRGQVVKAPVDEAKTVLAPLAAGEMSIHHVRVIHGSEPNRTGDRRIGMVLRYCATDVRQTKVAGDRAILVKGEDVHRHFAMIPRPRTDLGAGERRLALQHGRTRHKALMED